MGSRSWWNRLVALAVCLATVALPVGVAWGQTHEAHAAAASTAAATQPATSADAGGEGGHEVVRVNPVWMLPFGLMLAAIALMPFIHRHWWEHNYPYVAIALALVSLAYYIFVRRDVHPYLHEMMEYVSFIALLGSLFVISGGIVINIGGKATPAVNFTLLLFGAVLANIFGTTGASMVLIRPYLEINKKHLKPYHVVFFIFIVANVGGALTPIGDPPLFLGYLRGVPFWWVLNNVWPMWIVATALLLSVFFAIDVYDHGRFEREQRERKGPVVQVTGLHNLLLIGVVLLAVFRPSIFEVIQATFSVGLSVRHMLDVALAREPMMMIAAILSLRLTSKKIHERNGFNFGPIREVALLFIGIFATMVPALEWLKANANTLPLKTPGQYYFTTGVLSSVLDNAPTYLTFLEAKLGDVSAAGSPHRPTIEQVQQAVQQVEQGKTLTPDLVSAGPEARMAWVSLAAHHSREIRERTLPPDAVPLSLLLTNRPLSLFLIAISIGAVFFGACTYIGNGPNFMVKSIAESSGVKMPGFFAYVVWYTLPVLIPVYVAIWAMFLR